MLIHVYTESDSCRQHLLKVLPASTSFHESLPQSGLTNTSIRIIHTTSYHQHIKPWLENYQVGDGWVAMLDDKPSLQALLSYSQQSVQAYCNTYMAAEHYQQLIRLLPVGQSWYPPELLAQSMSLAFQAVNQQTQKQHKLSLLTDREKQIALAVASGDSNKVIAINHGISEPTVKTHLGKIFQKLSISSRSELMLALQSVK